MNLSAPSTAVFVISLILAVLALIAALGITIPFISDYTVWVAIIAYIVLAVGNLAKGL